jgi:hypothetical protein
MSRSCAAWRGEIGTEVVGALDPQTSRQLARHLASCADCRAEYDELLPVRHWLGMLSSADASAAAAGTPAGAAAPWPSRLPERAGAPPPADARPGPPPEPAPPAEWVGSSQPSARSVPGRRRYGSSRPPAGQRRLARARRRVLGAAAAVAGAAAAAAVILLSGGPAASFHGTDQATGVHGQARLHATATGTRISLTVAGLRQGERCTLVAVTARGSAVAGTWYAAKGGSAAITGWSAFPSGELTWLRVESAGGRLLLGIALRPARAVSAGG